MPRAAFIYSTILFGCETDRYEVRSAPASIADAERSEGHT